MAVTKMSNSGIKTGVLKYDSMLAGNSPYIPPTGYNFIAYAEPAGSNLVTFSAIPQIYTDLQIRGIAKSSRTTLNNQPGYLAFNGDYGNSNTNYRYTFMRGYNSGYDTTLSSGQDRGALGQFIVSNEGTVSNVAGSIIIDIQNYTSTTAKKVVRYRCGATYQGITTSNTNFQTAMGGFSWDSTAAITSLTLFVESYTTLTFVTPTRFALYGIKAAS